MTLTSQTYPRTLNALPGNARTVWLFESLPARRAAEQCARAEGRELRIRSAYKTLLHDVLEDDLLSGASSATIHYPVVDGCPEDRFRLECYPLHALFEGCDIVFEPMKNEGAGLPEYLVETPSGTTRVACPVRWSEDEEGEPLLSACGWYFDEQGRGGHLPAEYEAIFARACAELRTLPLDPLDPAEPDGPFFKQLDINAVIPAEDTPLPVGHECISLAEALHEDIYFTAIEIFRHRLGLGPEERSVKFGQVVPRITSGPKPSLEMALSSAMSDADEVNSTRPQLEGATRWLSPAAITAHLDALGGARFETFSRQGRPVQGTFLTGTTPAQLAISAGQHANESSPIVGALRAARDLAVDGKISFTLNPLENPDGYAVFRDLCRHQPHHMHHAARYTASGADLSHGGGAFESGIRDLAQTHLAAGVHVNLHGYPSHEWTRPLSGYIPRGFGQWTIPKGFFLILRHAPGHASEGQRILNAALAALAALPDLVCQNRRMLALYDRYVSERAFEVFEDCVPFTVMETTGEPYAVTLITEAPDETVYGEDFRIAHEGQYAVVKAVAQSLLDGKATT